jgi:hypothetical protein
MRLRHPLRDRKGIDTIIASLLMVVIVVIASVMVYVYATGLFGALLAAPKTSAEAINLEYPSFSPNNNQVTLYLRNTGGSAVTLISYYVKDNYGNQYSKTSWSSGNTFAPTTLANANITISNACVGCTSIGVPFTFQTGNAYTVNFVSSRGGQFSYTIIR